MWDASVTTSAQGRVVGEVVGGAAVLQEHGRLKKKDIDKYFHKKSSCNYYHVAAGTGQGVVGGVVASDACGDGDVGESVDVDSLVVVVMVVVDVARDSRSRSQQRFRAVRAARTLESAVIRDLPPAASQRCSVSGMPPGISSASDTWLMAGKKEALIKKALPRREKKNEEKNLVSWGEKKNIKNLTKIHTCKKTLQISREKPN